MKNDQDEIKELIAAAPGSVRRVLFCSLALGILLAIHGILAALASDTFSGKTVLYGVLIFFSFLVNGGSLYRRSKLGYVLIGVFALLPVLGSFAGAVHLLALIVSGNIATNAFDSAAAVSSVFQCVAVALLFYNLLSTSLRDHVWKAQVAEAIA